MKKVLLTLGFISLGVAANAQNCSDLFISEYMEGTGQNKVIEIYNPTASPKSLVDYVLVRWDNGTPPPLTNDLDDDSDASRYTFFDANAPLVPAYGVVVFGLGRTGQPDPAENTNDTLLSLIDSAYTIDCDPNLSPNRTFCFNGDDAMMLAKKNPAAPANAPWKDFLYVDIIGVIGEQPKNFNGTVSPTGAWTGMSPFFEKPANYTGNYRDEYYTQDHRMIRKYGVKGGVTVNPQRGVPGVSPSGFNASIEWERSDWRESYRGTVADPTPSLGWHECECKVVSVKENELVKMQIFPNPAQDVVTLSAEDNFAMIRIVNIAGQTVVNTNVNALNNVTINVGHLNAGVYMVESYFTNGSKVVNKIVKQ